MTRSNAHSPPRCVGSFPITAFVCLGLVACRDSGHGAARDVQLSAPRPHVGVGQDFDVGGMQYRVLSVRVVPALPTRTRVVTPPAGSAWVIIEFRRTWRGEASITVPAMPLEIVTRTAAHIPGDIDGLAAHIERTNCGELGPSRLDPLHDEHNCEVFAVPLHALEGATVEPAPGAHRGSLVRPIVDLGALILESDRDG